MSSDGPLQPEFQSLIDRLLSLPQMRGAYVYSGYRNNAHQARLFEGALKKYGSVQAARHWVAPEGHSNHNHAIAADLGFANDGQKKWLRQAQNSGELDKMGLQLRMSNEGWHVEPYKAKGDHADFFGTGKDPVFTDTSLDLSRVQKWGPHRANGPPGQATTTLPEVNVTAPRDNYDALIGKYAQQYGVPPELLLRMMQGESSGQPGAVSNKGARGLLQLMPGTAKAMGVTDPHDPEQNIMGGAKYLRQLHDNFGNWHYATAAYNAGPNGINRAGDPSNWPSETQQYVQRIRPADFDSPNYQPPQGLLSRMGVTPMSGPGTTFDRAQPVNVTQRPEWTPAAPSGQTPAPGGFRPMPEAPRTPASMSDAEFEQYKSRSQQLYDLKRRNAPLSPPPGWGDNSHVKAGFAGLETPEGYQDVSQGGMNSMQQLGGLMAMILRGL